jgi:hypothetical protein
VRAIYRGNLVCTYSTVRIITKGRGARAGNEEGGRQVRAIFRGNLLCVCTYMSIIIEVEAPRTGNEEGRRQVRIFSTVDYM